MTYTDPLLTLKTILDTITIPPETGNAIIPKNVVIGWLDDASRNVYGELTPTYSIVKSTTPFMPLDSNDSTSEIVANFQVDVWCETYHNSKEKSVMLMEKMLEQLRTVIRTNRANPGGSIRHLTLVSETNKDEADKEPVLRRTMVLVQAKCFR